MAKSTRMLLLCLVAVVVLMNAAYAQGTKLNFTDVDVKVGSKTSKNLDDGDTIDDEAEPGDTVEFRVEVTNSFTNAEDLEIEDITVQVTIEEVDDGDDLEEESSDFNLKAGRDKRVTLKFQLPIEVDEDTFNVLIHAEGEDENGTNHEVDMDLELEVDKESHLLKITRASLTPAEASCNRRNMQASLGIINIGNEDESKFSNTYSFNVPNDAEAGSYPITFRVLYDDDRKKAEESATLTVNDCATAKKEAPAEEEEAEEDVEVITPSPTTGRTTTTVIEPEAPAGTTITQESFLQSNAFVTGIIAAEVIAVIVGIVLVVALFRRKS